MSRERDIDDILGASLEAMKDQDWQKATAMSTYAIAVMMRQGAQAPATPAPVETPAEGEAPRRAPRRTSAAGDADCGTCGERFNSKDGKYKHCWGCGRKRQVLCQSCKKNRHQPEFSECQECAYGEAA